jgi:protein transport protein SEC31
MFTEMWRALNYSTAMANHDRELALAIHVNMLTRSSGDDITLWMSGVKQLIMRL